MTTDSKPVKSSKLSYFLLLLVLGLGASQYYLYQQYLNLNSFLNNTVINKSDLENISDKVENSNKALNDNILNLQKEIQANSNRFQSLDSKLASIQDANANPSLYIKLINVESLVSSADRKIKIDQDVVTARRLLEIAEKYLQEDEDTKLSDIRKSLLKKINQLNDYSKTDTVPVIAALEESLSIISGITAADLMINKIPNLSKESDIKSKTDMEQQGVENTNWQNVLINVKNDLLQLVKIRNIDATNEKVSQMLDQEQISILKIYFRIKITEAISSLNVRDIGSYNKYVNTVKEEIATYFVNNKVLEQKLLDKLESASNLKQDEALPDISDLYADIKLKVKTSS